MAMLCVWLPEYSGANKGNVGHASLLLDKEASAYISWWPNDAASLTQPASSSFTPMTYQRDVVSEGRNPHHTLSIDCLDEPLMESWWNRISLDGNAIPYRDHLWPRTPHYHLFKTNCANIVALAMRAGGAEKLTPMPKSLLVLTPNDVLAWGQRINSAAGLERGGVGYTTPVRIRRDAEKGK